MANDSNKVLSIGNLKVLKDYINKTGGATRELISEEMKSYLDTELVKASNNLSKEYETEFKKLSDKIAEVEANGTPEELAELKLQMDALNANFADKNLALDALDEDLKRLSGDFSTLYEGIETGSVFSAGQLNEIIKTTMIKETTITPEMIETPNLFTEKIVALIGNFGHINAGNIDAGTIAGSNIQSIHKIAGTDDPVWVINDEGDGWLAKQNISWDKEGNVTFGPGVEIKWESVKGADNKLNTLLEGYDDSVKSYINQAIIDRTDNAVTQDELQAAYKLANDSIEATKQMVRDSEASAEEMYRNLQTSIEVTADAVRLEYTAETQSLNVALNAAKEGLEKAIADGDEKAIKEFGYLIEAINSRLDAAYNELGRQQTTINSLGEAVNKSLDPEQVSNLLAASLITETQVGPDSIKTPNVLAKEITALLGTFGNVDAADITSNTIEGFTVQAPTRVRDEKGMLVYEEEPNPDNPEEMIPIRIKRKPATWQLNYDGSGYVGKGLDADNNTIPGTGISWSSTGDLTLGSDVTIKWDNVDGGKSSLETAVSNVTTAYGQAITESEGKITAAYGTAISTAIGAAKTELNQNISDAEARAIAAAEEKRAQVAGDLSELETVVTNLKNSAATATALADLSAKLTAMEDDTKLSPSELSQLNLDVETIVAEYNKLSADIDSLNTKIDTWKTGVTNGSIPNPGLTVEQIAALKITKTSLSNAKKAVTDMYTYYSTAKPNADSSVNVSESYPLSCIPSYYAVQNEYLVKYQNSANEYLTYNRFGSKTTYLGADGIYSGTISGDQIIGKRIAGLTVESGTQSSLPAALDWYSYNANTDTFTKKTGGTGPTWQIYNDGSGHLAKGNIYWTADGTLNAKINGSFDGGSNGTLAGGAITWDSNSVTLNKNLKMASGVSISWNQVSGTSNVANKSDIPSLDNYATKDYVDQNGGITEDQFTELGDNWIKTTSVTCDNLNVRKVETKSSAKDRIEIKDNHIYCINNSGDKNLIISSNALDTTYINKILATGITGTEDVSTSLLNNITLSSGGSYTDFPYRNSDIWVSSGTIDSPNPKDLGYVLKGSTITCYMGVQACPTKSDKYSVLQTNLLAASEWVITEGSAMTYVVGGSSATRPTAKSGGYVLLYKKNSAGQWEDYDQIALRGDWTDAVRPYQSTTSGTARWKTKGTSGTTITIDEDGEYGILLGLEAGSVYAKTATAIQSLVGYIDVTVNQNAPATYTEIGKDGIVVYDGTNILKLDSSGVEMKAKSSVGSDKFYGIKVTSTGLKLCKNGTSWVSWNPSYD